MYYTHSATELKRENLGLIPFCRLAGAVSIMLIPACVPPSLQQFMWLRALLGADQALVLKLICCNSVL